MDKVNLAHKFSLFQDYWHPHIVGELDDSYIKLAKLKGEFVWHRHEAEDDLFLVVKGRLLIRLLVNLDPRLAQQAADAAAQYRLRGSDAVYAAVALRFGTVLMTLDREQHERLEKVVTSRYPAQVLADIK